MAADGYGSRGEPQFDDDGAPDTAVDPTLAAQYAGIVGNRVVGTSSERAAFTSIWPGFSDGPWDGLVFHEDDTGITYKRMGGAWKLDAVSWTDFTPTMVNLTLGTGGIRNYAKYCSDGRYLYVEAMWTLGTSGFSVGDMTCPLPSLPDGAALASFLPDLYLHGDVVFYDSSAGAFGRYRGGLYRTTSGMRLQIVGTNGLMASTSASTPFSWGANDQIIISGARVPLA